jgi:hypothetical protein
MTMRLAQRFRTSLLQRLPATHFSWPFEDRVLVWLLPTMAKDVAAFHHVGAQDMASMFQVHQLEHLDEVLSADLRKRLDAVSPPVE